MHGRGQAEPIEDEALTFDQDPSDVLAVDEALTQLERMAPRAAAVVAQRYFAGLTVRETAEVLGQLGSAAAGALPDLSQRP